MFEKREFRRYQGVKREDIYPQICDFWARQGFYVAQLSPFHIQGQSYISKIGLRREFFLRMDEQGGNTYIDLQFQAKITDEGLVGGAAAAVIFWPVALVGGALSYKEYEDDARNLMWSFWGFVDQMTNQSGVPTQPPLPPAPPPPAVPGRPAAPCKGCGALLPQDWKACPYCGKALTE
ncbi:MAG: zinc ribbon domain-containing protein [Thermoplasmata archaeon]|nr:MAG: zinc ribbon domain-containing protein [Thermoplasmata archaeon]